MPPVYAFQQALPGIFPTSHYEKIFCGIWSWRGCGVMSKKAAPESGLLPKARGLRYEKSLRPRIPAKASKPAPRRSTVPGSGTVD